MWTGDKNSLMSLTIMQCCHGADLSLTFPVVCSLTFYDLKCLRKKFILLINTDCVINYEYFIILPNPLGVSEDGSADCVVSSS